MVVCWCTKWCCYKDPYDEQCRKIVTKNNKRVRCKRYGKKYHNETNRYYYCEMHYNEIVAAEKEEQHKRESTESSDKRESLDSCYECSSSD